MENKIVLITGATGGIGKAVAMALARQDFTVVIHGRNAEKTRQVCKEIKTATGNNRIDCLIADLFLLTEVRKLANEFILKYKRLDILINNAGGIMNKERSETAEGIETTMAVNLFAPFLLTELLSDMLKKSLDGRVINVSSNSHQLNAKPDPGDMQMRKKYNPLTAYGNAKLYLIWITQYLARTLKESGINNVTVNTLHPGAVATSFGVNSDLGPVLNFLSKLMRPLFRTAEQGADTIVYLASATDVQNSSGNYYVNRKKVKASVKFFSQENENFVWEYCRQQTKA